MSGISTAKTGRFIGETGASIKSIVKIAMTGRGSLGKRRRNYIEMPGNNKQLFILGNGPSLRQNIENDLSFLQSHDSLAVNFAANAPEFGLIRPKFYLLADPHFFRNSSDPNVERLIGNLNNIGWEMTLFVPLSAKIQRGVFSSPMLKVATFPFVAVEGWKWLENMAFNRAMGMPRPRNVLIPSIMVGAWLGYQEIYLLGADHSWLKTLDVTEDNRVVSVQPHFYKEDEREEKRIRADYVGRRLHEVLESMQIAFRSYHRIRQWADRQCIKIYNATPGSMIDAFERKAIN